MTLLARSFMTCNRNSFDAGVEAAQAVRENFPELPKVVIPYLTVNHDQTQFLKGLRSELGKNVLVVGCSAQGVINRNEVREEGYAASVMGLGGDSLEVAAGSTEEIQADTHQKGKELGRQLRSKLGGQPKFALIHYDPLSGVDIGVFLEGLHSELDCPVIGGASSHFFGATMSTTYQYIGESVLTHAAVVLAVKGQFTTEMGIATGCSPIGIDMTVTRADGNVLLELDGRPALDVWREVMGVTSAMDPLTTTGLAIGVPRKAGATEQMIRAAFLLDIEKRGIVVGTAIPTGSVINLHHRTVDDVMNGTANLAKELKHRLGNKTPRAVLCFECGARTRPFLGVEATLEENVKLQSTLGPDAEWIGVVLWGEIYPVEGRPGFHNYTYPILALAD